MIIHFEARRRPGRPKKLRSATVAVAGSPFGRARAKRKRAFPLACQSDHIRFLPPAGGKKPAKHCGTMLRRLGRFIPTRKMKLNSKRFCLGDLIPFDFS